MNLKVHIIMKQSVEKLIKNLSFNGSECTAKSRLNPIVAKYLCASWNILIFGDFVDCWGFSISNRPINMAYDFKLIQTGHVGDFTFNWSREHTHTDLPNNQHDTNKKPLISSIYKWKSMSSFHANVLCLVCCVFIDHYELWKL